MGEGPGLWRDTRHPKRGQDSSFWWRQEMWVLRGEDEGFLKDHLFSP